ncbi:sugar phosphate nucleotidyltransferase [Wolbachia endosymbiont of Drosophila aff. chauvacae BK-2020]|uniref:sugar phosphate nucleotidyltransferase n=1 Tax=Wolbachia endosymbiont of Drosophila aff. chauvacae BK-2020 TaxID=3080329 RepID=UPI002937007B|nr:sugar phosphate nucleotidyltransferase [Wolbachia endosymbiont of Drosophila aff. chauvacae BK-2020]WOE62981.1 sugar phosphate nucleotidyltransferase [Wolbachia endosymbiont of Drosophila aff. chauvacae BK-2020]
MRPVILCGGSGSRLWPLSKPKQFQKIFSQNTMFHNTLLRLKSDYMPPIIATNIQYESLVMEELHVLQEYKVIFEPVKIGTAAAILIAALLCNENETMLILPSDHFIGDLNSFYASAQKASKLASETNSIVTFGVKPHEFNSEYGYINAVYDQKEKCHIVKDFTEKPECKLSNDHYWNSGIFVFRGCPETSKRL